MRFTTMYNVDISHTSVEILNKIAVIDEYFEHIL